METESYSLERESVSLVKKSFSMVCAAFSLVRESLSLERRGLAGVGRAAGRVAGVLGPRGLLDRWSSQRRDGAFVAQQDAQMRVLQDVIDWHRLAVHEHLALHEPHTVAVIDVGGGVNDR